MKKKNVLVIIKTLIENGISKYVERTYTRLASTDKYNLTVLILSENNPLDAINKLKNSGIKVIDIPAINKNPFQYFIKIKKIVSNDFDIVHFHADSWVNFYPIKVAADKKIKKIMVQSHNSSNERVKQSKIKQIIHYYGKRNSKRWTTNSLAVSKEAAQWLFEENENVEIISNPVDVEKFKFSFSDRNEIRKKYDIDDKTILFGNVARFDIQKNPLFLVDIFKIIHEKVDDSKLIMIGSGELKDKVLKKIDENGLQDNVIIKDWTNEVEKYYSAIDEIIFPSLYEGFPLSLIEAQCSGSPIVYSDSVTKNIEVLKTTVSVSLEKTSSIWANTCLENLNFDVTKRKNGVEELFQLGFDYESYENKLGELYSR